MIKPAALAVLSLLLAGAFVGSASAQSRPTAITCDQYKKELSLAITKARRTDAEARTLVEEYERQRRAQGLPVETDQNADEKDKAPPGPPQRDFPGMERHRRDAETACAQRKYPEAINEYIQAFNAVNVPVPPYLPVPRPQGGR